MKQILVLGAGQSSPYLIDYLLTKARERDWFVTVGDRDAELAARRVGGHACGDAIGVDANDFTMLAAQIGRSDVVINLLSPAFQHQLAVQCVAHGKHMISASYRDQRVRDLHTEAQRKGSLILTEIGLDPGIDHMSAMRLIERIRQHGGIVKSFVSYGSGVPAPDSPSNPLQYVVTWNPRNVVMAGENGAQYLVDGQIKIVPYPQVFQRSWPVEVDGVGTMEAYPNRDSLSYMATFGLEHVTQMIRGTLRYPGWSEIWRQIVQLGLPNETLRVPRLAERTWAELVEMFLPRHASGANLEQRVASHLGISPTGTIMRKLKWLGLLANKKTGVAGDTAADAMIHLLRTKLALKPGERDMVVLFHELEVAYPQEENRREKITSTLVAFGEPDGFTAMSKTVGLPAALAASLILDGVIPLTGSHIPTHPSIYEPILAELEKAELSFAEKVEPLPLQAKE